MFFNKICSIKFTILLLLYRDENVLKEWRRDKRSYSKAMAKAMKRNEGIIEKNFITLCYRYIKYSFNR